MKTLHKQQNISDFLQIQLQIDLAIQLTCFSDSHLENTQSWPIGQPTNPASNL